jgi:tRNA modification GTPase
MARSLLPASPTLRTTTVLLDQLRGAMSKELVHIKSLVRAGQRQTALTRTSGLLDRADLGRHLVNRWSVVIAGHPNAGKSSLINRLLGYERAVVFDQPGTTRDLITVDTAFDGWPVTITDTAGLRGSQNQIEIEGIRLATETIAKADLVILVEDMSCHSTVCVEDFALADKEQRRLVVGTKLDLLAGSAITRPSYDATTSALTGEGILGLGRLIAAALVTQPPPAGAGVPLSADEVAQIERVHRQLAAGDLATAAEIVDLMTADLPSRS